MIKVGDAGNASVGEGASQDEQAGLPGLEFQQAADAPLGQQRPHGVLGTLQRGDPDEELMGCHAREIIAQVARSDLRVDVALLDLQRCAVLEVRQERIIE
jgi:hypothetical protein